MKKSVKIGLIIGGTSLILGLAGLFWYLGMTNNNRLIAKIPKDSFMVFKADLKSLADKSEFKKWKELEMFNRVGRYEGDEERIMKDLLKNPKKSGINFLQNAYGFVGKGEDYVGGMVFGIKDAKDFEETVKSLNPDLEIQKIDGIYSTEIDKGDVALVWDKNEALMYFSDNENVVQRAKDVFQQDEDISMLEDDVFMEFDDLDADLGMYGDMKRVRELGLDNFGGNNESPTAGLEKVKSFGVTVLFDDQQMLVDAIYYPEENATPEEISMMKEEGLSDEMLKLLSPIQPKGYYAANFNLDKVLALYPQINQAMQEDGFSMDELKNGLTGEVSFTLIDVKNVQTVREVADYDNWDPTYSFSEVPMKMDTTNELTPIYKLNFGVKDKGVIDNLIAKYVAKMNEPEPVIESFDFEDSFYRSFDSYKYPYNDVVEEVVEPKAKRYQYNNLEVLEMEGTKILYKYEGNYLSISNDESAFNFANFTWDEDIEEMITSKASSGYMNLDYKNYPDIERENPRDVQRMKEFLLMLDNAKFTSDGMNFHFEMNFTDSPDHILWRLMKAIDAQNSSSAYN